MLEPPAPAAPPAWSYEPETGFGRPIVLGPGGVIAIVAEPEHGPMIAAAPAMLGLLRRFVSLRLIEDYPEIAGEAAALIDDLDREARP